MTAPGPHSALGSSRWAEAGLGPLSHLFADDAVTEVMVNGPGRGRSYVERAGRLEPVEIDLGVTEIERLIEQVVLPLGLRLDRASPMVEARLPCGSRLHAVIPPLAPDGPCLTIRRLSPRAFTLDDFGASPAASAFLDWALAAGWNLLVSGGTGAGKTALLNALSGRIPGDERLVTIEETAELRLASPHVVRLEARPVNAEGLGAVSVRDLVRCALRMRPDRLLVGEVRGVEAFDMVQALNTGHSGSLSTIHANGPKEALVRLETLVALAGAGLSPASVRDQIAASVDAVIQVRRGAAGARVVASIVEVGQVDADRPHLGEMRQVRGPEVRILFARGSSGLFATARPTRPCRRPGAEPALELFR